MAQSPTQRQILDELVQSNRLTDDEARRISAAPIWSLSVRELVGYLAGLIIAAGTVQIIAVVFQDASRYAVVAALYAVTLVAGLISWQLSSRGTWQSRLAEVLEGAALGSALGATGLVLDDAEMSGQWIGFTLFAIGAAWGALRTRSTRFIGTVALSIWLPALAIVTALIIEEDSAMLGGSFMLLAAAALIVVGLQDVGAPFVARAVGSLYAIIGSMTLGTFIGGVGLFIPLVVGVALFSAGSSLLTPEMLVAGAFCVVAGVVMTTGEWIESELARGLVIVATGLVVLAALGAQMRRRVSRPAPGAPAV
ncbi:MAG: hypothetical protein ACO3RB_01385 [Ilumatobacteraceae bacterium]